MQFPKTRHKIEAAEVQLGLMERHARKVIRQAGDPEWEMQVFRGHLSAFLAAGMSVRDNVMRMEHQDLFNDVHPAWERNLSPEDRRVRDAMRCRRNEAVKTGRLKLERGTALIPASEAQGHAQQPRAAPHVAAVGASLDAGESKVGVLAPKFVDPDGTRADVFSECRRYLALLKELVAECERFSPPSRSSP